MSSELPSAYQFSVDAVARPPRRFSGLALLSVLTGAVLFVGLAAVRIVSVGADAADTGNAEALLASAPVWGVMGLLSAVPIAFGIIVGHVALSRSRRDGEDRALAGAGVAIGYLLLGLWLVRVIVAAMAMTNFGYEGDLFVTFLANIFYWA